MLTQTIPWSLQLITKNEDNGKSLSYIPEKMKFPGLPKIFWFSLHLCVINIH